MQISILALFLKIVIHNLIYIDMADRCDYVEID